ncbi:MAG: hypothetical protein ACD_46C00472G0001, partial [uncultured bacterium]
MKISIGQMSGQMSVKSFPLST